MNNMNLKQVFEKLWDQYGLSSADYRKQSYFDRSMKIPYLQIGNIYHFVMVFPSDEGDFKVNCKGDV